MRVGDGGKLIVASSGNSVMAASWIFSIFFDDEIADQSFLILDNGGSGS